jgi:hypothetical protein
MQRLQNRLSFRASVLGRWLRTEILRDLESVQREPVDRDELTPLGPVVDSLHYADRLVDLAEA